MRHPILTTFGLRIRELRTAKNISQEDLALRSGMDRSYVGGVERGERNISLVNIGKLADALEEDLALVFAGLQARAAKSKDKVK